MGLKELNLLFSSISAVGLLPHSILVHQNNFRIKRFETGWKNGKTWWFGIVALTQLIWSPILTYNILKTIIYATDSSIYSIALLIWQINYVIIKFIPLFLVFYAKRLKHVLETLGKVDQALKNIPQQNSSTVKRRTQIGLLLGIIWPIAVHLSGFPSMKKFYNETGSFYFIFITLCVEMLLKAQVAIWFLVFHMSFYCIAHRIANLRSLITCPTSIKYYGNEICPTSNTTTIPPIHQRFNKAGYLIDKLAKASYQLEVIYSVPALMILSASFVALTISLFVIIKETIQPTLNVISIYLQLVMVAVYILFALTIIYSADLPVKEVKRLQKHVLQLSTEMLSEPDRTECAALLLSLERNRFQLSAGGMFTINKVLIPTLTGTVLTYLVILLQNAFSKRKGDDISIGSI